ncbi:MAG: DUF7178 family protein, partial [Candidatus Puniceispirillaceae bacterium]
TGETLGPGDYRDPYAIAASVGEDLSEKEVMGTMGGFVPGVVGGAVTGPQDLAALIYGGGKGLAAEEGEGIQKFLEGFSAISGVIGSEALFGLYEQAVDALPIGDEAKQGLKQGAVMGDILGAVSATPKAAKAGAGAVADYAAGAPARLEDAKSGVTLGMGVDPTQMVDEAIVGAQKLMGGAGQVEANPNRISTRLPTAKGATEDPIAQPLQIGLDEVAADPVVFEHNVGIVKNYPNMTEAEAALPPAEASEAFIEHAKNNLLWVFDKVPEQTRERSKKWYDGARAITDKWSEKYNLPDSSIAGVLAALSPQKDWYMNVSLGERVLDIMTNQQDTMFTKEMLKTGLEKFKKPQDQAIIKAISNKKLSELELPAEKAIWLRLHDETYADRSHQIVSPEGDFIGTAMTGKGEPKGTGWGSIAEISKAVSAFESGGDKNILTPLMGTKHKVRSFYNNILDPNGPNGDVTIDTHAVAAALLRPLSGQATEVHHNFGSSPGKAKQGADWFGATKNSAKTGVQGNYGLYAEAYRRAAAERGVLPREMQSITWEAVRGLFTDKFKGQARNVDDVNQIWYKYRKGEVSLDEARNAVEQRAGGINPPTWQRSDGGLDDKIQDTAD